MGLTMGRLPKGAGDSVRLATSREWAACIRGTVGAGVPLFPGCR
jgi:hypothetical protein